jgi:16S rRNA processing protein RimM
MSPPRVAIGQVVGAHGLHGCLKVRAFGDGPENLLRAAVVTLGGTIDDPGAIAMEVVGAEAGGSRAVRMSLAEVEDREAAAKLRGRLVMVDSDQLETLAEGEYYQFQLVGCQVEGDDGQKLGTVREIWPTGGADVLVVENAEGGQHLLPTGGDFLQEVDIEARRIVVRVIPGLLDPP